jgi:hypothetical protein
MSAGTRAQRLLARALRVALALAGALGVLFAGAFVWYPRRPLPAPLEKRLFQGIGYRREIRRAPLPAVIHLVTVDVGAPGLGFVVTPGDPARALPLRARTTSGFLEELHVQVAVNGDFFTPWHSNGPLDYYPHPGDPVTVDGYASSDGVVYARGLSPQQGTLRISRDGRPSFSLPLADAWQAISGEILLRDGVFEANPRHAAGWQPRTAVGLDREEKRLLLVVVDGRQHGYSEGLTLEELAALALREGAVNALNLDGGGSSALVIEGEGGRAEELNTPIHMRIPWRERPVANHLGIRAARE